jgi:hypothetical protein
MINLGKAFTTAWSDLKKVAAKAAAFVAKEAPVAQQVIAIASTTVAALDPALAPEITAFDSIEEALVGEVTAALGAVTTAPDPASFFTISLPGTLYPALKAIASTLSGHPAVVAAGVVANPPKA